MYNGARLESLEIKLAYLEDALEQLDRVVVSQQQELDLLRTELKRLQNREHDEEPQVRDIEPPPHY